MAKNPTDPVSKAFENLSPKFKYRPSPLNIAGVIILIWAIYAIAHNWPPTGEAKLALIFFPLVILGCFFADIILQLIIKKYFWLAALEIILMIVVYRQFSY